MKTRKKKQAFNNIIKKKHAEIIAILGKLYNFAAEQSFPKRKTFQDGISKKFPKTYNLMLRENN